MILERDNEQLKVHNEMQKEFINVAAHELRAPVQPILALTEQLGEKIKNKDQVQLLDVVIRNAQRLKNISEDILDVTKFESNSLHLTKEKCSLNQLIFNIVTDFQNNLENDKKIKFDYNANNYVGGVGPIMINADKNRISQVISNLINNSVKFIKKEGTISVSIDRRKTYDRDNKKVAVVVIKDTGSGIDDEMFPKLFKKFATKSFQGTGLGLYICKNIVESHGGKIWAENNKDEKGSTFSFCLPLE
jgi:signal transduction histidine kinase